MTMNTENLATVGISSPGALAVLDGQTLCEGRFRIEAQLGAGSQGAVFRIQRCGPAVATADHDVRAKLDRHAS